MAVRDECHLGADSWLAPTGQPTRAIPVQAGLGASNPELAGPGRPARREKHSYRGHIRWGDDLIPGHGSDYLCVVSGAKKKPTIRLAATRSRRYNIGNSPIDVLRKPSYKKLSDFR